MLGRRRSSGQLEAGQSELAETAFGIQVRFLGLAKRIEFFSRDLQRIVDEWAPVALEAEEQVRRDDDRGSGT